MTTEEGMCVVMVILDVLCMVGESVVIILGITTVAIFSGGEVILGLEVDCVCNHG